MAKNKSKKVENEKRDYPDQIKEDNKVLKEPEVHYYNKSTISNLLDNRMAVLKKIEIGITNYEFQQCSFFYIFHNTDWAKFLNVSTRSLQRYIHQAEYTFNPIQSERIFEIAEVTKIGEEVFGSLDELYDWLKTPSLALGNERPIDLLNTSYGKELVINEIRKIDYGIFS